MSTPSPKPLPDATYLDECFSYDPDTGSLVWKTRPPWHFPNLHRMRWWNSRFAGKPAGGKHVDGYTQLRVGRVRYLAHRIIWKLMTGEDPPDELDHRDINKANDKWINLRSASQPQNMMNRPKWSSSRGKLKGAYRRPTGRTWYAQITIDGKAQYLGNFSTEEEAHDAWRAAALSHHGDFFNPGSS